ncbi:hypothetical protein ACFXJ8_28030 [Nonomuraea sp. NPDC059194]|uniref:hypothetical protein n=1 Tax=Nonomuraea sp. NPDC059194 TaxID=3346764 RepID=UPI00369BB4F2
MTEEELRTIEERANAATPGPWHLCLLDDAWATNLVAISTTPHVDSPRWPAWDGQKMVAATLVQFPERYIDIKDARWDENADFIAHARSDVPRLVEEIRRLRTLLASQG